ILLVICTPASFCKRGHLAGLQITMPQSLWVSKTLRTLRIFATILAKHEAVLLRHLRNFQSFRVDARRYPRLAVEWLQNQMSIRNYRRNDRNIRGNGAHPRSGRAVY